MSNLIQAEIEFHTQFETLKKGLQSIKDYKPSRAFRYLAAHSQFECIDFAAVQNFMSIFDQNFRSEDVKAVMRRLVINGNWMIS